MKQAQNWIEEFIPLNGTETYLLTLPAAPGKPVVLFLHGGPGVSESCFAYAYHDMLGDACTLAFYDQRGAGRTLRRNPDAPLSIGLMLHDLDGVIKLLKKRFPGSPIVLLGHSWGTVLGALYALRHPERIARYIGVGQVVSMTAAEQASTAALRKALAERGTPRDQARFASMQPYPPDHWDKKGLRHYAAMTKLRNKYSLREPNPVPLIPAVRRSPTLQKRDLIDIVRGNLTSTPLLCACMNVFDLTRFSAHWRVPALFIQGARDHITHLAPVERYFDRIDAPEKQLVVMADCGHSPMIDRPDLFARHIREQLAKAEKEVHQ